MRSLALLILLPLLPSAVVAGDWRVTPIRLELGRDAKSGVVTIVNESEEKLQVQMSAMEWTQDAAGKDAYADTSDLLFFPRMMILEKKEEKILRAGIKVPAGGVEKTYRLFIEEIPGPGKAEGANIAIAIRFGVPIFVRPLKEEFRGEAGPAAISAGTLHVPVRNAGNAHFVIQSVLVSGSNGRGEEIFSREIAGWYLLAGASRAYTTPVPPEACGSLSKIDIEVRTDHLPLRTQLVADPSMCGK
ncbi:MAG: molecular chaperone [Deltaproteobacteria bacterium]|nr:molecular chaperone [Deltaproteobacteria bacterium]